jgi:predicted dehydrogenase
VASQRKRRLFVGQVCRFFPEYVSLRQRVQAGDIGRAAMVRASRCMGNPGGWYDDPRHSLGVAGDLMLHDLDLCLWMFGEIERVYAFSRARRPPLGEQHVLASLRHTSGVISHVAASWAHIDGFRTTFEVAGSAGVVEFDSGRRGPLVLKHRKRPGSGDALVVPESPAVRSPYEHEVAHFLDVVEGRTEPRITAAEALRALEIALAVDRSARSGMVVRTPPRGRSAPDRRKAR